MKVLQVLLEMLMLLLVAPALFAGALTLINRQTKLSLAMSFGPASEVYLGGLGIIIHELSHLLVALVFGHHITSVKLIQLPPTIAAQNQVVPLGYVNHSWNQRNWYQTIGNLFIGVAPIFGNTLALWGLTKLLWPSLANALTEWALNLTAYSVQAFWVTLTADPVGWWQLLLLIVLSTNIIIGGFDLSPADYQNSALGLWTFVGAISLITVSWQLLVPHAQIAIATANLLVPIYFLLGLAVLISLIVMGITWPLRQH